MDACGFEAAFKHGIVQLQPLLQFGAAGVGADKKWQDNYMFLIGQQFGLRHCHDEFFDCLVSYAALNCAPKTTVAQNYSLLDRAFDCLPPDATFKQLLYFIRSSKEPEYLGFRMVVADLITRDSSGHEKDFCNQLIQFIFRKKKEPAAIHALEEMMKTLSPSIECVRGSPPQADKDGKVMKMLSKFKHLPDAELAEEFTRLDLQGCQLTVPHSRELGRFYLKVVLKNNGDVLIIF